MFVFISLLVACIVQSIFNYYRILTIPYNIFLLMGGFVWGELIRHYQFLESFTVMLQTSPQIALILYLSISVFRIAFCLDSHSFFRSIYQILLVSIPVYLITAFVTGFLMNHMLGPWNVITGILFGVLCSPTYPILIVRILQVVATQTHHLHALLEGEALITTASTVMINKLIMGYLDGFVVTWYHFVCLSIRLVTIGLAVGYVVGLIGRMLVRQVYQDIYSIVAIICALPFLTFCIVDHLMGGSGVIAVSVMGIMMGQELILLPKMLELFLTDLWRTIAAATDIVMTIYCAIVTMAYVYHNIKWQHLLLAVVTFLMYFFIRFFAFFAFFPLLRNVGLGLSFKNLFVWVWSGSKNSISLLLVIVNFHYFDLPRDVAHVFFFHLILLQTFSFIINVSFSSLLLRLLKLTEISMVRQISMNNCMKHIFTKKNKAIATLKMDRFLADTNWSMVNAATSMKHPYRTKMSNVDEDNDYFMGFRYTTCPDCKAQLVGEPTPKELKEMTREAKMRILKTKKMSYARQFENGMVSSEGVRILSQAVESAMDTEGATIELDGFHKKFTREGCFSRFIRYRVQNLNEYKKKCLTPPKKALRRFCFYVVTHKYFEVLMAVVILLNLIPITIDIYYHSKTSDKHLKAFDYTLAAINTVFYLIYLFEFVMKILAYSAVSIKNGFKKYFRSFWNIFDFTVLFGSTIDVFVTFFYVFFTNGHIVDGYMWYFSLTLEIIRFSRILKLLRVLEFLYPTMIKRLDSRTNTRMTSTYELGKTYVTGEEEVLELLPHIIDNKTIREDMRRTLEADRLMILKLLGLVQKDRPWVAITVKTKQAMRTILNSMKEAINQIKSAGWIDDFEHAKLLRSLDELYKQVNSIKLVEPSAPKVIFGEVPWMAGDEKIVNFLFEHVIVKKFEPFDVVFEKGFVADGIYIVVAGLLTLNYSPEKSVLDEVEEFGRLPIVDYISSSQFNENVVDYIVSGNCVGELSTLTNRPYNCTISAVTHTQVYGLNSTVIREAMKLSSDPINGLECRIWKAESIRLAVPILMAIPAYQSLRPDQIKYALERAFVPDLSNYKIFIVTDKIQDILLIEGVMADFNSRDIYTAPCYMPRTVQKFILPTSSLMNIPIDVATKLLIIPEQDIDERDIMELARENDVAGEHEEESARSASKCLHRTSQPSTKERILDEKKPQKTRLSSEILKQRKASVNPSLKMPRKSGDSRTTTILESELMAVEYIKTSDSDSRSVRIDLNPDKLENDVDLEVLKDNNLDSVSPKKQDSE